MSAIVHRRCDAQLFSIHRGSEYLPSTLPTVNGTLYWSVTRDTEPSVVFIKASNAHPSLEHHKRMILTALLGRQYRRIACSHDVRSAFQGCLQGEPYFDHCGTCREQLAREPGRRRVPDFLFDLCRASAQLHCASVQRQRIDCICYLMGRHIAKRTFFLNDIYNTHYQFGTVGMN